MSHGRWSQLCLPEGVNGRVVGVRERERRIFTGAIDLRLEDVRDTSRLLDGLKHALVIGTWDGQSFGLVRARHEQPDDDGPGHYLNHFSIMVRLTASSLRSAGARNEMSSPNNFHCRRR